MDVLFDHGDPQKDPKEKLGRIVSWFGPEYRRDTRLAFLDIAVVRRSSNKSLALIEIEERKAPPKVIIADVLATLLGDHVSFQGGQRHLDIGAWTTLIVLAYAGVTGTRSAQLDLLNKRLNRIRGQLSTPNASIGNIVVDTFQNVAELEKKLLHEIERMNV